MNFDNLKNFMDSLTSWIISGNSISVYLDHKEVFRYNSGYSDKENKIPMQGNELFNIYSCSKVATVTAALQLYEKGVYLLDDPLYEYVPEFRDMYVKTENGDTVKAKNPITLRSLFTMTAGFSYDVETPAFNKAQKLTAGKMDTVRTIKCLAEEPLLFEPGEHWNYSLCHDVLAAFVEVVSGKRFCDYVHDNIFAPLGMNASYYHKKNNDSPFAVQYRYEDAASAFDLVKLQSGAGSVQNGKVVRTDGTNRLMPGDGYDSGGAGIITTVSDYAKLADALANGGTGATGEKVLSAGTIELMRTNQLNEKQLHDFSWPQLKGYGYGLGVRTMIDRAKSGSNGSAGEFGWGGAAGATVASDPDLKLSYFYTHHMLNPQEEYYQPRLRNIIYSCI